MSLGGVPIPHSMSVNPGLSLEFRGPGFPLPQRELSILVLVPGPSPSLSSASRSHELPLLSSHIPGLFSAAATDFIPGGMGQEAGCSIPDSQEPALCTLVKVAVHLEWRSRVLGLTRARPGMQRPSPGTTCTIWSGQVPVSFRLRVGRQQTEACSAQLNLNVR